MADFDRTLDFQRLAADRTGLARSNRAEIGPGIHLNIAIHADVSEVKAIFIRAGGHPGGAPQRFVGENLELRNFYGPETAGFCAESGHNLLFVCGAELTGFEMRRELCLVEL